MASVIHEKLVELMKELARSHASIPVPNEELMQMVKEELTGFVESETLNPRMIYANSLRSRLRVLYETYLFPQTVPKGINTQR